jgi:hypothetical protein
MAEAGDALPDATEHAEEVREELVLTSPRAGRKQREPSKAERLYRKFQDLRLARCAEAGVPALDEDWAPARQNKALGPFARLEPGSEEADLLEAAWEQYLADDGMAAKDVPWGLGFFLASLATWKGRALKAAGGGA